MRISSAQKYTLKKNSRVLKTEAFFLKGFWLKMIGVAFKECIQPIFFETRFGIHTFFVKKPIDVFIMDKNNIVKVIKKNLRPWRIFVWNPQYYKVVETVAGEKRFLKLKVGDKFKNKNLAS